MSKKPMSASTSITTVPPTWRVIEFNNGYLVSPALEDWQWLEVMQDLEDLDFGPETMLLNLRLRPHLAREKRMLLLDQLNYFC